MHQISAWGASDDLELKTTYRDSARLAHPFKFFSYKNFCLTAFLFLVGCGEPVHKPIQPTNGPTIKFHSANKDHAQEILDLIQGRSFFMKPWVFSPSSTKLRDGLGPHFIERACSSCHPGHGPAPMNEGDIPKGVLARVSSLAGNPLPILGSQLQTKSHPNSLPEAKVKVDYLAYKTYHLKNRKVILNQPKIKFSSPHSKVTSTNTLISLRRAPPVIGQGEINAIQDESILKYSDPTDKDKDGISGKPNWIPSKNGKKALGKFGWKSNHAFLETQIAAAFLHDIGITSHLFPETDTHIDSTNSQNDELELSEKSLKQVTFYLQSIQYIQYPAQNSVGKDLFEKLSCSKCHVPSLEIDLNKTPFQKNKNIFFYSDFLLHDMGEGLSDHRPDHEANGNEWRTSPLWGLRRKTTQTKAFLHDGRAKTLEEAILWHGGEAENSKTQYLNLSQSKQKALITFLETL